MTANDGHSGDSRDVDNLTIGSLCSGIGGLDLAVEAYFGAELAWYAELAEAPWWVMQRHWPGVVNHGSIIEHDWDSVSSIDILTAGYPCQPFSHAGKRQGADDERHLWPYVLDAICDLRPRWVVLENVAGHLSLGFGDVLGDLAEAGFDAEWCVLRASDVGAPHQRARLFIVATDANCEPTRRNSAAAPAPQGADAGRGEANHGHGLADGDHLAADTEGAERRDAQRPGVGEAPGPAAELGERTGSGPDGGSPPTDSYRVARSSSIASGGRSRSVDESGTIERVERLPRMAWGQYESAIRRWEQLLGRPAPRPTDDEGRLEPTFVEWMMGYPEGWVDGLTRA